MAPTESWCSQCFAPATGGGPVGAPVTHGAVPAQAAPPVDRFGGPVAAPAYAPPAAAPQAYAPAPVQIAYAPPPAPAGSPAWRSYAPPAPTSWQSGPAVRPLPDDAQVRAVISGRMLGRRAITLVLIAIGLGVVFQVLALLFATHIRDEPSAMIRYAIVFTLGFYVIIAVLISSQVAPHVRLRWNVGEPATSVVIGVLVGGGCGAVLLTLASVAVGHLAPDPSAVMMVSEGDAAHIVGALLILCVAAPLVEEVLFRGLLLESLRATNTAMAVLVSALAFAAWHLKPASLVYYTLMGVMFGVLYLKRGLVGSMTAHACFNGVLCGAAIYLALAPGPVVTAGEVRLHAPHGWTSHGGTPWGGVQLRGPSGSLVEVQRIDLGRATTVDEILTRLETGEVPTTSGVTLESTTAQRAMSPGGEVATVALHARGHGGALVMLPHGHEAYEFVLIDAGSTKADTDFRTMLATMDVQWWS